MGHPKIANQFTKDADRAHWHDGALWFIREKRDNAIKSVPEWETLRQHSQQIKSHTMANLDTYLTEFEEKAKAKGIHVHWAKDGDEHNRIVLSILNKHSATRVVKSKSMLTEECGMNHFLENNGINIVDTDLGERIVQLRNETPSHIVLPAIHLKKEDVSETFNQHLGTEKGNSDPLYLTRAARSHLREKFLNAEVGMTGVNFAIAETGGIVVCTNEGNADLGTSLPKVHIASMGIEKIIPRLEHLSVFTRVLARSATGQPITVYTTHYHEPIQGGELHVILVDNGRSDILNSENYHDALNCIRCGSCMNTCPVFRRSGGHSYGYIIPGPIGSTLASIKDLSANRTLPYACSLCGSCTAVCPVQIDLEHHLYNHRRDIVEAGFAKKLRRSSALATFMFKHPLLLAFGGKKARFLIPKLPRFMVYNRLNTWGKTREIPTFPKHSFKEMYKKREKARAKR